MAAKKTGGGGRRGYVWMQMPTAAHVEQLRKRLSAKGPLWDQWEYKLHRDRIVIYDPVDPMNPDTGRPDPALRYMAMHLRVSPVHPGPFGLEYRRHTDRWQPLPVVGTIDDIAAAIEEDVFGVCTSLGQHDHDRPRRGGEPV